MDGLDGRHKRYCNGAITLGPDAINLAVSFVIVLVPIALFLALVAPDVGKEISWVAVGIAAGLCGVVLLSFLLSGLRDPGIIPRNEERALPEHRNARYAINGHEVFSKYCTTCHVYRPPRTSHCAVCDSCIEKFDHHCPWLGTCIGRRNYQTYLIFIFSATLTCLLLIGLSVTRLVQLSQDTSFGDALREEWAAPVVIIYCGAALTFVGTLTVFHTYLLSTNQTTYEYFRHRAAAEDNPYNRGLCFNCQEAFCAATGLYAYYGEGRHPALVHAAAEDGASNGLRREPAASTGLPAPYSGASYDAACRDTSSHDRSAAYVTNGRPYWPSAEGVRIEMAQSDGRSRDAHDGRSRDAHDGRSRDAHGPRSFAENGAHAYSPSWASEDDSLAPRSGAMTNGHLVT